MPERNGVLSWTSTELAAGCGRDVDKCAADMEIWSEVELIAS